MEAIGRDIGGRIDRADRVRANLSGQRGYVAGRRPRPKYAGSRRNRSGGRGPGERKRNRHGAARAFRPGPGERRTGRAAHHATPRVSRYALGIRKWRATRRRGNAFRPGNACWRRERRSGKGRRGSERAKGSGSALTPATETQANDSAAVQENALRKTRTKKERTSCS